MISVTGKEKWTRIEEIKLVELIDQYGKDWNKISGLMQGRSAEDLRERYKKKLDPKIKRCNFTKIEDELIMKLQKKYGHNWDEIAKYFDNRDVSMLKNRYYSHIRKVVNSNTHSDSNFSLHASDNSAKGNSLSKDNKEKAKPKKSLFKKDSEIFEKSSSSNGSVVGVVKLFQELNSNLTNRYNSENNINNYNNQYNVNSSPCDIVLSQTHTIHEDNSVYAKSICGSPFRFKKGIFSAKSVKETTNLSSETVNNYSNLFEDNSIFNNDDNNKMEVDEHFYSRNNTNIFTTPSNFDTNLFWANEETARNSRKNTEIGEALQKEQYSKEYKEINKFDTDQMWSFNTKQNDYLSRENSIVHKSPTILNNSKILEMQNEAASLENEEEMRKKSLLAQIDMINQLINSTKLKLSYLPETS